MSNKSLVQIVMALQQRVAALEERPSITPEMVAAVARQFVDSAALASKPLDLVKVAENVKQIKSRSLCPKCGDKPAYFFHVRTCTGQKEEKQDADTIRRRDQGTP